MRILRVNTVLFAVLLSSSLSLYAQYHAGLTARDYYRELYAAGEINHMANGHACFQDDPKASSFFILRKSKNLRDSNLADDTLSKVPQAAPELAKRDFVMVRGYTEGIPWRGEELLEEDEGSWISDLRMLDERTPIRIRFNINWETLRYKYAVEMLDMDLTYRSEAASFGSCEEIPADKQQHLEK
jgi:hypothetical protein